MKGDAKGDAKMDILRSTYDKMSRAESTLKRIEETIDILDHDPDTSMRSSDDALAHIRFLLEVYHEQIKK